MIKFAKTSVVAIVFAVAGIFAITGRSSPPASSFLSVSISNLNIAAGERVVGFEFHVTSGRIVRVPDMPIGWNISVDNDPSWNTKITGSIMVAAAAVDSSFFRNFLVVEKDASLGIPLRIQGDVVVSKDFVNTRKISISMTDLTVVAAAQR